MPHARLRSNKAVNAAAEINFWRPYFIVATHAVPFAGSNCREKTDDLMRFIVASHLVGARAIPIRDLSVEKIRNGSQRCGSCKFP